jgi:hypothetical protein
LGTDNLPYEQLDAAITNCKAPGLRVNITELDIVITRRGGGQLSPNAATTAPARRRGTGCGGARAVAAPLTPGQLAAQVEAYARLYKIFQKYRDAIGRVK